MFLLAEKAAEPSLIDISFGLMFWTLLTFVIVLFILKKYAIGPLQDAIEARRNTITHDLDAAERAREEAQQALQEYRAALAESRREATKIVDDARRTAEEQRRQALADIEAEKTRQLERARSEIAAEVRQSLQTIKTQLADLTVAATEKVLRTRLDEAEQKRLIDAALADVDLSAFAPAQGEQEGTR
jgi:F-type H+-transporting ATPase subunit b